MMQRQDSRPVNLSLWHFRFPPNAIASISHRISGVLLLMTLVIWLVWLNVGVLFPQSFAHNQAWLNSLSGKLFLSVFWLSLAFHWLAGLRHLLIEFCLNQRLTAFLRKEQAVWMLLGFWLAIASFSLVRIWL